MNPNLRRAALPHVVLGQRVLGIERVQSRLQAFRSAAYAGVVDQVHEFVRIVVQVVQLVRSIGMAMDVLVSRRADAAQILEFVKDRIIL